MPPTHPLNPINPDNARILRITAAAGTELADAFSSDTCNTLHVAYFTLRQKRFTTRRAVFPHATWLVQSADHWPIFLTAASRRSLVRVSVPVWGTFLSEPLMIVDLVGLYPTNYLIIRIPIFYQLIFNKYLHAQPLYYTVLVRFSTGYPIVEGRLHTCYSPVRRSPPSYCYSCAAPRLACVRPVASVHPEPGSNSSLYSIILFDPLLTLLSDAFFYLFLFRIFRYVLS